MMLPDTVGIQQTELRSLAVGRASVSITNWLLEFAGAGPDMYSQGRCCCLVPPH